MLRASSRNGRRIINKYNGGRLRKERIVLEKVIRLKDGKPVEMKVYKSDSTVSVDKEMDKRARLAVREAVKEAKEKKYPVAKYDKKNQKPYLEYANKDRKYGQ